MTKTSLTAATTARATASLASTRAMLARLDAQRTALRAHEAAVLVHSIAVQNLADYPDAALITFTAPNATNLTVDRILDAEDTVLIDATDEVGFEIGEALQGTAIAALARESDNGVFRHHGIYAVMASLDGYVGGQIDLLAAAAAYPELPRELQAAETRPLSQDEQQVLVDAAETAQERRVYLLDYVDDEDDLVASKREIDETAAVLADHRDGEHADGIRILDTLGRSLPPSVGLETYLVELARNGEDLAPVRLCGEDGQELAGSAEAIARMVEDGSIVERLSGLGAQAPEQQLWRSGITVTDAGLTVSYH